MSFEAKNDEKIKDICFAVYLTNDKKQAPPSFELYDSFDCDSVASLSFLKLTSISTNFPAFCTN